MGTHLFLYFSCSAGDRKWVLLIHSNTGRPLVCTLCFDPEVGCVPKPEGEVFSANNWCLVAWYVLGPPASG